MPDIPGLRPDVILFIIAVVLYLSDAAYLLFTNEVLFVRGPTGVWAARYPNQYPEVARRFLAVPRPLEPYCAVLRAVWPGIATEATPASLRADIDGRLGSLRLLQWGSALLLPQIFVVLPLLYVLHGGAIPLLIALGVIYLQASIMVFFLIWRRRPIGISGGRVALIAFESLVCIPYAINLYRKAVRFGCPVPADILLLDRALLSGNELAAFRDELATRVGLQLDGADRDRSERLRSFRDSLREISL